MRDGRLPRVRSAEVVNGFVVRCTFTDGTERLVDLEPFLRGPIFEELRRDPERFRELRVDPGLGTIVWPNGADVDPDVLYGSEAPAWRGDGRAS